MKEGAGSTLPGRNPLTRPASSPSLPERSSSPAYLSPRPHRRPRTPRSSPLAGPSVSPNGSDNESKDDGGDQKPRYRPNRISSTPDIAVPVQSLYSSDATSFLFPSPPATSVGSHPPALDSSSSSSSSEDDKEKEPRSPTRSLSIVSSSSLATSEKGRDDQRKNRQRSTFTLRSASTSSLASISSSQTVRTDMSSHTAPPIPTIPRWALNAMREEAGVASRNMKYGHDRGTRDHITDSSMPPGAHSSTSGSSDSPPFSSDPTENWTSVTALTPKFSRMSLRAEGVVMPVRKESLPRTRSTASIRSAKSTASSLPAGPQRGSGDTSKTVSGPGTGSRNDSNAVNANPNLEEDRLRKRGSFASSFKTRFSRISVSLPSDGSENVPPLPLTTNKPEPSPTSVEAPRSPLSTIDDSATSQKLKRRSAILRRDSVLTAIDEAQLLSSLPPPLPNDTPTEFGRRTDHVDLQDTQSSKPRRKGIKQIVMWITTAPTSTSEKLKLTTIHNSPSTPVLVVPPDSFMPLDPPPRARFDKRASSSVPSLVSTKEVYGDARSKKFKSIKKRWNAVFGSVRG